MHCILLIVAKLIVVYRQADSFISSSLLHANTVFLRESTWDTIGSLHTETQSSCYNGNSLEGIDTPLFQLQQIPETYRYRYTVEKKSCHFCLGRHMPLSCLQQSYCNYKILTCKSCLCQLPKSMTFAPPIQQYKKDAVGQRIMLIHPSFSNPTAKTLR